MFGFDLECLENRRINNQDQIRKNKPFYQLNSEAQKNIRLKALAYDINSKVESLTNLHDFYNTKLEHIELNINGLPVKLQNSNSEKLKPPKLLDSIVRTCDESLISRDGYRRLAAFIPEMECGYKVDENRQEITGIMDDIIPVHSVQINSLTLNGAYRSIKKILLFLIPKLAYSDSPVLQIGDVIHIKLSGDGRQVSKHHNHVMFMLAY